MEVYFDNLTDDTVAVEKLVQDVSSLVENAEQLVQASGANLTEPAKAELAKAMEQVKTRAQRIKEQALSSARATDRIVRRYPYQSLGVVFGAGVLLGVLIDRVGSRDS